MADACAAAKPARVRSGPATELGVVFDRGPHVMLASRPGRHSVEKPEPMVGQTWTLDGDTDVVITDLVVEITNQKIYRLEFRKPDGIVKSFTLREFLSRAEYREG
jgi:hypothetical protein